MVDEITPGGLPELGIVETKTTNFGGHPPEFWAERLADKICLLYTSDAADES